VIAGLLFVPAVRPWTRHIPDAPPVLAPLPEYQLRFAGGAVVRSSELLGRVYVLGMYGAPCEPDCSEVLPALTRLSERFRQFERRITVVAVHLGTEEAVGSADEVDLQQDWWKLEAEPGSLDAIAEQVLAPQLEGNLPGSAGAAELARKRRLFVVDAEGYLRGHYGIDESSLDEVYHRAQHVLRDHRRDGASLR